MEAVRANRARQCELYGAPLGDRVRHLTARLGVSQARLARVLGISPAMLSQLVSGRRVKIGDPAALARLRALDQGRAAHVTARDPQAVEKLLTEVACLQWRWTGRRAAPTAAEILRGVAEPGRLAAAAAALGSAFPEVAEVLRQASRPGPSEEARTRGGDQNIGADVVAGNVESRVRLQSVAAATVSPRRNHTLDQAGPHGTERK